MSPHARAPVALPNPSSDDSSISAPVRLFSKTSAPGVSRDEPAGSSPRRRRSSRSKPPRWQASTVPRRRRRACRSRPPLPEIFVFPTALSASFTLVTAPVPRSAGLDLTVDDVEDRDRVDGVRRAAERDEERQARRDIGKGQVRTDPTKHVLPRGVPDRPTQSAVGPSLCHRAPSIKAARARVRFLGLLRQPGGFEGFGAIKKALLAGNQPIGQGSKSPHSVSISTPEPRPTPLTRPSSKNRSSPRSRTSSGWYLTLPNRRAIAADPQPKSRGRESPGRDRQERLPAER